MDENNPIIRKKDYILLKDFKVKTEVDEKGFILCFWVSIFNFYSVYPKTILEQVYAETNSRSPLLVLNGKTLMLLPLTCLLNEAPGPGNTDLRLTAKIEQNQNKWIHVGYEVSSDFVRLCVNGEIAGERHLSCSSRKRTLIDIRGDRSFHAFIHDAKVLPSTFSIKDQYVKDPPLRLSIDKSTISNIEEDQFGFWHIFGGKASRRRIFSLDVVLLDIFGKPGNKELEVVASLLYAFNRLPVRKINGEEPPLLVSCDGIEFASSDRPGKLSKGRASFKLKISKLSSGNGYFCIKFGISRFEGYRVHEEFSPSIHSMARRPPRKYTMSWKKISAVRPVNGSQSIGLDYISCEPKHNTVDDAELSPTSKRVGLGEAKISNIDQHSEECNTIISKHNQAEDGFGSRSEARLESFEEVKTSLSDSKSIGARDSALKSMSSRGHSVSGVTTFRYCLGGLTDRSLLLKEIATVSDEEISGFADQVSVYSGCSHHSENMVTSGASESPLGSQRQPCSTKEVEALAEMKTNTKRCAADTESSDEAKRYKTLNNICKRLSVGECQSMPMIMTVTDKEDVEKTECEPKQDAKITKNANSIGESNGLVTDDVKSKPGLKDGQGLYTTDLFTLSLELETRICRLEKRFAKLKN